MQLQLTTSPVNWLYQRTIELVFLTYSFLLFYRSHPFISQKDLSFGETVIHSKTSDYAWSTVWVDELVKDKSTVMVLKWNILAWIPRKIPWKHS